MGALLMTRAEALTQTVELRAEMASQHERVQDIPALAWMERELRAGLRLLDRTIRKLS